MPIKIWLRRNWSTEEWLEVAEDGGVMHRIDNLGWAAMHGGVQVHGSRMSLEEAKKEWPRRAAQLDLAAAFTILPKKAI
jgi:hypothetical protein